MPKIVTRRVNGVIHYFIYTEFATLFSQSESRTVMDMTGQRALCSFISNLSIQELKEVFGGLSNTVN